METRTPTAATVRRTHRKAPRMAELTVVVLISALLGIQPVTTDLYLPALPELQPQLGASMTQVQMTFAGMVLAFGASQLVWGPLSDRFGRRPILLWGLALYTLAALACAVAPSMNLLLAARVAQGAALGAPVMAARALLRDLYTPLESARMMARGLTGLGFIAIVCVPVGSLLVEWLHWRATLAALAVFGVATLALVALRFRETLPRHNPRALAPRVLWRSWAGIARHPTFLAYSLLSTASYATFAVFLTTSPFIFMQQLGVTPTGYGVLMAVQAVVYISGTVLCRRLLPRLGARHTIRVAGCGTLAAGLCMAAVTGLGPGHAWYGATVVFLPQMLFMLAHGVHQAVGQSGAVSPFPQMAGAASALNGFMMMSTSFAVGWWLGTALDDTPHALGLGYLIGCSIITAIAWTLVQKHGELAAR